MTPAAPEPAAPEPADAGEAPAGGLDAALRALAAAPTLLVAVDFDGTLAPIVDDPAAARPLPAAVEALAALGALPRTRVALVSGRDLESLDRLYPGPEGILRVASHGAQYRLDGLAAPELTAEDTARVAALSAALGALIGAQEGESGMERVRLELKPAGMALHTRGVDPRRAAPVLESARGLARAAGGWHERGGKEVLEFSALGSDKGEGIRRLRAHTGADAVFYAGDDLTDEDGFAALGEGDLGLKCGPGSTLAAHRVADPEAVARALADLARYRSAAPEYPS